MRKFFVRFLILAGILFSAAGPVPCFAADLIDMDMETRVTTDNITMNVKDYATVAIPASVGISIIYKINSAARRL